MTPGSGWFSLNTEITSFAGRKKQDSVNQLNPVLFDCADDRLEAKDDAQRESQIVLRGIEKACPQVISFGAQRDGTKHAIVDASTHGSCERSVRRSGQGSAGVYMRETNHDFAKRSPLCNRNREPRAEEIFLLMACDADGDWAIGRGFDKVLRTVVSGDITDNTDPR